MYIAPFLLLACERRYWSPPRLARTLWGAVTNIHRQLAIFQVLAHPAFNGLVLIDPRFPFKHLIRNYLVRGLTISERAACFLHHYRRLRSLFRGDLLRQISQSEITLFQTREDGIDYAVTIGLSRTVILEGELFLRLKVDDTLVYSLQFTIVPGWVTGSQAADVALITRIQGARGAYCQVYAATKALREVAPPALLVAVLQGVAKACGIREMAGISATNQFSFNQEREESFKQAYDRFFLEVGASRTSAMFFSSSIPLEEKSTDHIKNGHKSRTRKKRAFKLQIAEEVCRNLLEISSQPRQQPAEVEVLRHRREAQTPESSAA